MQHVLSWFSSIVHTHCSLRSMHDVSTIGFTLLSSVVWKFKKSDSVFLWKKFWTLSGDENAIAQPTERTATLAGFLKLSALMRKQALYSSTTKFSSCNKLLYNPKEKLLPSESNILVHYQGQNVTHRSTKKVHLFLSHKLSEKTCN